MSKAALRAAVAWKSRVYVFEGADIVQRAFPPCPCKGLGLVARQVEVRGTRRYTFDPCRNPECSSSDRFKENPVVKRRGVSPRLTPSQRG